MKIKLYLLAIVGMLVLTACQTTTPSTAAQTCEEADQQSGPQDYTCTAV